MEKQMWWIYWNRLKIVAYLLAQCCVVLVALPDAGRAEPPPVMVFAAASTTNAVTDIADKFKRAVKISVKLSFASSSTLAKQIASGAPAAVYISANKKWMDFLAEKELLTPGSRFDLLSNRIVLIAPVARNMRIDIAPGFDLAGYLGDSRLAMGDPAHVPAGMYGKKALQALGAWEGVKSRLARAKDVRSALVLVERGEAPLGLVYATDAAITDRVRIVGRFPVDSHPPIVYPVALVAGNDVPGAMAFLTFLKTPGARAIFEEYGFTVR